MLGVLNIPVSEHFSVRNNLNQPVPGIDTTSFEIIIFNSNGVDVTNSVNPLVIDLLNGNYKIVFTPDLEGTWYISISHDVYFPWGKSDDIQVYTGSLSNIYLDVRKTLGLVHENIYIDNPVYDDFSNLVSARVRIYSDAVSVGTNNNIIATYQITAQGDGAGKFTYWRQEIL